MNPQLVEKLDLDALREQLTRREIDSNMPKRSRELSEIPGLVGADGFIDQSATSLPCELESLGQRVSRG